MMDPDTVPSFDKKLDASFFINRIRSDQTALIGHQIRIHNTAYVPGNDKYWEKGQYGIDHLAIKG